MKHNSQAIVYQMTFLDDMGQREYKKLFNCAKHFSNMYINTNSNNDIISSSILSRD